MWRKMHSERDPRDTLFSELNREFGAYANRIGFNMKAFFDKSPKATFGIMVAVMLISAALSFTIFRSRSAPPHVNLAGTAAPVSSGFDELLQATGRIRETLHLKRFVDSLSHKKELTSSDSTALIHALDRLQQLNKH